MIDKKQIVKVRKFLHKTENILQVLYTFVEVVEKISDLKVDIDTIVKPKVTVEENNEEIRKLNDKINKNMEKNEDA